MEQAIETVSEESTENIQQKNGHNEKAPQPEEPKKKKEERAKIDKNVEQYMKSLNSISTVEEKLSVTCKKYVQMVDDNKKLQFYIKQSDKRYALLLKEKDQLQHEFNKTVLVKSKLENLCRELQKQNKAIKEESLLKIREEEERRKETQAKFQNTLSEITTLLQQNNEKNTKLRDDNISMSEKFKSVVQQYQLREQQVEKMAKQMALESQLSDAKLQKAGLEHQAEKERLLAEMEQLKVTIAQCRAKIMDLQANETALKGQLTVYTDKYDEFQNALVKSNQVFGGFKDQMDKMSKKIKKLEKESLSWKNRWETSQTALLDMVAERQASEERAAAATRQLQHMQGLCRTLQAERGSLLAVLKENNIERPPLPTPPPSAPAPPSAQQPASNAKADAMAANCAQLRQSLAHLQTQLNTLTNKNTKEEPPKPEKTKKSKSKKNKDKSGQGSVQNKNEQEEKNDNESIELPKIEIGAEIGEVNEDHAKGETSNAVSTITSNAESNEDKIVDESVESLIEAITNANTTLSNLEFVNDEKEESNVALELNEPSEAEINIADLSLNDISSNEELAHITEVKSISNEV